MQAEVFKTLMWIVVDVSNSFENAAIAASNAAVRLSGYDSSDDDDSDDDDDYDDTDSSDA